MAKQEKKVRWNTYNYNPSVSTEKHSDEVLVQPNQAFTIHQIFEKFRLGVKMDIEREGFYTDTDDFDEIDERQLVKDHTDISEAEERISARRKNKDKAASQNAVKGRSEADNADEVQAKAKDEVLKP